jgi:glycosyltransferase involved in cell wall biosynthesis
MPRSPMSVDRQENVSVIVTTRNSGQTLEACLQSVRRQTYTGTELVVVDNHSSDGTLDIAERYADKVATIGPERSAQRNHGASLASGELLLFIDADMVLDPEVVDEGARILASSTVPAVVIPEETVGEGFWTACRSLERDCYNGDDTIEAARFYTRAAFTEATGFDTELNGGEDWDLSRRVAQGRRLPRTRAIIHHDEGRTRLRTVYKKRRYYAPGYLAFVRKHGRGAIAQGNPIFRAAYIRNWRTLGRHPLLTAGMFTLKAVELAAVLDVAVDTRLRGRVRDRSNEVYAVADDRDRPRFAATAGDASRRR